ncbi:PD-(D/E)XK nuclease family protein [Vulcanisaeta thermophila]|uniref:PD-(D/E)XK nuclease family protein n=1 Tax=Vulcanisaeta thermophila TaxID=867917 RepID=UPI000853A36A|nr:DUF3782 domain-containing protein [Vulcanisaeta thermophila]
MQFDKEAILKALKEDESFRYAVLGLLGIDKILQSIDENTKAIRALQEQVKSLDTRFIALQEQVRSLQEQVKSLQEQFIALQEQVKALQAQFVTLQEQVKSLQEQVRTLQAQFVSLEAQVNEHTKAIRELAIRINALGTRWGVVTEEAFRDSIKYLVEDLLKTYKVSKWVYYDAEGIVYGYPSLVDVDVLIRDTEHILVEFKSYVDRADVTELYRIGQLYEKANGIKPRLLMVASAIRRRAKELADQLGIACRGSVLDY